MILPVAVNLDGFTLSHVIEPIEMPDQAEVDAYLPPFAPQQRLDIKNPISMGMTGVPEVYTEARKACLDVLEKFPVRDQGALGRIRQAVRPHLQAHRVLQDRGRGNAPGDHGFGGRDLHDRGGRDAGRRQKSRARSASACGAPSP